MTLRSVQAARAHYARAHPARTVVEKGYALVRYAVMRHGAGCHSKVKKLRAKHPATIERCGTVARKGKLLVFGTPSARQGTKNEMNAKV